MMDSSENEETPVLPAQQTTKVKKKYGRLSKVKMNLKLQSFETGDDCTCKLKCFDKIGVFKGELIKRMNSLGSNDAVNAYLAGLITVTPVQTSSTK